MHTIVVGTERSDRSQDAVALAALLARSTGAHLRLVHVIFPSAPVDAEAFAGYVELVSQQAAAVLRRMEALAGADVAVTGQTVTDLSPARALQAAAEETGADLIVIGSTHVGRTGRVLPGSTGERLLHGSPCPVAIAPRDFARRAAGPPATIGLADDHGAEAGVARDAAVALCRLTGAKLRIVGVLDVPAYAGPGLVTPVGYPTLGAELRAKAQAALAATMAALPTDVDAEASLLDGDPADVLVDISRDLDLLVLGSRGYGPLHAVLVGGVSGRVAREAACPVLVVPRGASVASLRTTRAASAGD